MKQGTGGFLIDNVTNRVCPSACGCRICVAGARGVNGEADRRDRWCLQEWKLCQGDGRSEDKARRRRRAG